MKVHKAQGPDRCTRDRSVARPRSHPLPLYPPTLTAPRCLAFDVHATTLVPALAEPDGRVVLLRTLPHTREAVAAFITALGAEGAPVVACYEAGPTGYGLARWLEALGVPCTVIAPSLTPAKSGDRVKTDRRDAVQLAVYCRAQVLTAIAIPDPAREALRDLVRAREDAIEDVMRARHRLSKFLLRHAIRRPATLKTPWTTRDHAWLAQLPTTHPLFTQGPLAEAVTATLLEYLHAIERLTAQRAALETALTAALPQTDHVTQAVVAALQCCRGIRVLSAVTIVAEVGRLSRFPKASRFMGYTGLIPCERSSGRRTWRGKLTRTGNAHLRRVLVEAAWSYRHVPKVRGALRLRQAGQPAAVIALAWKAQQRLGKRFRRLRARGKPTGEVVVAVARELAGFVWAIAGEIERAQPPLLPCPEGRVA